LIFLLFIYIYPEFCNFKPIAPTGLLGKKDLAFYQPSMPMAWRKELPHHYYSEK